MHLFFLLSVSTNGCFQWGASREIFKTAEEKNNDLFIPTPFSFFRNALMRSSVPCLWTAPGKNKLALNPSWGMPWIWYYFLSSFCLCKLLNAQFSFLSLLWASWDTLRTALVFMAVHPTAWSCCVKSLRAELLIPAETSCSLSNTH